jgi:hypothetical protein
VAEQRVVLEHEADLALARALADGVLAVQPHATGIRPLEAGHDAQQRGLAGARRAEQGQQLARLHLERDAVEGDIVAEALADVEDLDAHGDLLYAKGGNASDKKGTTRAIARNGIEPGNGPRRGRKRANNRICPAGRSMAIVNGPPWL